MTMTSSRKTAGAALGVAMIAAACVFLFSPTHLHAEERRPLAFDISPQSLATALSEFARQSRQEILFAPEVVAAKHTRGVRGTLEPLAALSELLKDTGVSYTTTPSGAILLGPPRASSGDKVSSLPESGQLKVAQATQPGAGEESKGQAGAHAQAQETPAKSSVEEIIVTATKRAERLQDVPMSIAVIGSQDIERRGLIGMEDYLRSIPGVSQVDLGVRSNGIVIRGISTQPAFENINTGITVGSYFDETSITGAAGLSAGGIDIRPVDIERIEVLRGPQGTAYGSSSLSGTLRIIPKKPQLDRFAGKVAAAYSDTGGFGGDNTMLQGVLNIPIVADKFAVRAVGYRYDDSGFYRNVAGIDPIALARAQAGGITNLVSGYVQDDVGRMLSTGGRLSALWQATANLSLSMNFLTQKLEQDGLPESGSRFGATGKYEQTRYPILSSRAQIRGETGEASDTRSDLANIVLNYDFGWAALTSAASWIESTTAGAVDYFQFFPVPLGNHGASDFKSFSNETRVASRLAGRFQFLVGVFYENMRENRYSQTLYAPGAPVPNPYGTDPAYNGEFNRPVEQRALFGEISYDLTDKLTATVGGRYFKYEKDEDSLTEGGLIGVPFGTASVTHLQSSESHSKFKASLRYEPTEKAMLYGSWSQGFRLGRPTSGVFASCDGDNDGLIDGTGISVASTRRVDSDFLDNYEIGGKFTLFDRRLMIDTAVYHIDWTGMPANVLVGSCPLTFQANAGEATSDGAELQITAWLRDGLKIDIGGGYTKAELTQDVPLQGWRSGDRLPGSPRFSANLAAQYDFNVAGYGAFIRADSFYVGRFYGDFRQTAPGVGDYVKVDARAGVSIRNVSVELFVRNMTNEQAFTWVTTTPSWLVMRPRTVGVQVGYAFE